MMFKGVWQISEVVEVSYKLKTVDLESLHTAIAFSSSALSYAKTPISLVSG